MNFRATAAVFALAIALCAVSTASQSEDCRTYPPGPQRFACASAQHPGMLAKQARCREAGMQMGLSDSHRGGLQQYVMACMQRK